MFKQLVTTQIMKALEPTFRSGLDWAKAKLKKTRGKPKAEVEIDNGLIHAPALYKAGVEYEKLMSGKPLNESTWDSWPTNFRAWLLGRLMAEDVVEARCASLVPKDTTYLEYISRFGYLWGYGRFINLCR